MLNKTTLQGRITNDLILRYTNSQIPVLSFSVAVDRNTKAQDGSKITDFFDCVAWRKTAENIDKFYGKGSEILMEGYFTNRKFQDKEGKNRMVIEFQVENFFFTYGNKKNTTEAAPEPEFDSVEDYGECPF